MRRGEGAVDAAAVTPVLAARLLVLTGPIAAGKSTVAARLTERLVAAGRTVACTDLDDVARLAHAPGGLSAQHWAQAHVTHGALLGALLRQPFDLVVAHGPFYGAQETAALLTHVPPGTSVLWVLLTCTHSTAQERVRDDPERGLSREPAFLRRTHDRFWTLRPAIAADLVADTGTASVEEVCDRVETLLRPVGAAAPGAAGATSP